MQPSTSSIIDNWSKPVPTVLFYHNTDIVNFNLLAFFDLDWTLARPEFGLFRKISGDITLLPGRKEDLTALVNAGYTIIIVSNQSKYTDDFVVSRVNKFINLLNLPLYIFIARAHDQYRKPNTGLANLINQIFGANLLPITNAKAFFVGDAAGRPEDFSNSDILWAQALNLKFYTPEQFFPQQLPPIPSANIDKPTLIVFVGMPGAGKSTFYQQYLQPLGYKLVSQDILKSKTKVLQLFNQLLQQRQSIVIDRTNPTIEDRNQFYLPAQRLGYQVITLYFVANGEGRNKIRNTDKQIAKIVYHTYFSKLQPPTSQNTPGLVYQIW